MSNIRCENCNKLIVKARVLQSVKVQCDECNHVQIILANYNTSLLEPVAKVIVQIIETEKVLNKVRFRY